MARLWADAKSPSDTHVVAALVRSLREHEFTVTVRDRAEAVALARGYGLDFRAIGKDDPRRSRKVINYAKRVLELRRELGPWDASVSFNNMNAILLSKIARKPSLTLMDNDLEFEARKWSTAKRAEMAINLRATRVICPSVFPVDLMKELGATDESIITFDGYKEDLYVADFVPDPEFAKKLPVKDYILVRPEALSAVYVRQTRSLVPDLLDRLVTAGVPIVYLPRVPADREHAARHAGKVHIPDTPLNGLQLAWHARAVMTGSGSFAREAACLGVPAISFFPERLLAVDARMVREGRVMHSRDPDAIVERALSPAPRAEGIASSRRAREELLVKLRGALAQTLGAA